MTPPQPLSGLAKRSLAKRSSLSLPRVSLRSLLIIPFVLQTLGTVGLVGFLSFRNGQAAVRDMATQLREESSLRIREHLERYLGHPMAVVRSNAAAADLGQLDLNDPASTRTFFWHQMQIFPTLGGVYLGDKSGRFLCVCGIYDGEPAEKIVTTVPEREVYRLTATGERARFIEQNTYDPRERPWYQKSEATTQPVWSEVYVFSDGQLGITAAASFGSELENGTLQSAGVAGVDLRLTQVSQFLQQLELSANSEIFIVEQSGELIGSSTKWGESFAAKASSSSDRINVSDSKNELVRATALHLQDTFGQLASIQSSQQSEFHHGGDRHFVQVLPYRNAKGLDWRIVVVVPEADFMASIQANNRTTLQLCLLALITSTLFGLSLSQAMSRSIERSSRAAVAVAGGNFQQRLGGSCIREVELLARSFNRMGQRLSQSFAALEEANAALEEVNETLEQRVRVRTAELRKEHDRAEKLLLNVLPRKIAEQLKRDGNPIARSFEEATILFADIVGFTPLASQHSATVLVEVLNRLFCEFDTLAERHRLEKIKTIGDAYMVAAGLPEERNDHASAIADMAMDMLQVLDNFTHELGQPLQIRIGINTGKVVAGVIGKKKFIYDLWGDSVNIAARMESSGKPGQIQVSQATYLRLRDQGYNLQQRGQIAIKGKGEMMTYWLRAKEPAALVSAVA